MRRGTLEGGAKKVARRLVGAFLTGLLFLLPVLITILLLDWVSGYVASAFGPDSLIGGALTQGGAAIVGRERRALGFIVGLAILVALIGALGLYVQTRARKSIEEAFDRFINRVPLLRSVYRPIAQLVRMVGPGRGDTELATMRPVAVRFGQGADTLALLVSTTPYVIGGEERLLILIPTAPVPMGGALLFMPPAAVLPVDGLGVEDLMKFYISMGTINPPALAPHPGLPAA